MKIETSYDVGDSVWFMEDDKPKNDLIWTIELCVGKMTITTIYSFFRAGNNVNHTHKSQEEVFKTKRDLLDSL